MKKINLRKELLPVILGLVLGLFQLSSVGNEKYPLKPINLIVPYPPGGGNDIVARLLSGPLSAELNRAVRVVHGINLVQRDQRWDGWGR
jgi:tripartite-type tricarboxylate transporter receptor subunit TctC